MAAKHSLLSLLEDEIKDLYSAERQLTKAIPKMMEGSHHPDLKMAFSNHLKETEAQVARLQEVAQILKTKPTGKKCAAMEGLIEEGSEILEEQGDEAVLDLGIIGAGSRVEHYEMSAYMTAISLAKQLGEPEVVALLKKSLGEEEATEKTLRDLADTLLRSAPAELEAPKAMARAAGR